MKHFITAITPTKPANAKVALEGLKQQHRGVDSQIKILEKKRSISVLTNRDLLLNYFPLPS